MPATAEPGILARISNFAARRSVEQLQTVDAIALAVAEENLTADEAGEQLESLGQPLDVLVPLVHAIHERKKLLAQMAAAEKRLAAMQKADAETERINAELSKFCEPRYERLAELREVVKRRFVETQTVESARKRLIGHAPQWLRDELQQTDEQLRALNLDRDKQTSRRQNIQEQLRVAENNRDAAELVLAGCRDASPNDVDARRKREDAEMKLAGANQTAKAAQNALDDAATQTNADQKQRAMLEKRQAELQELAQELWPTEG